MYDYREIKYQQKMKDNFNFVFLYKKGDITFADEWQDIFCSTISNK